MNEFRPREYLTGVLIIIPLVSFALISIMIIFFDRSDTKWLTMLVFAASLIFYSALVYNMISHYFKSTKFALAINAYKRLYGPPDPLDISVRVAMIERAKIGGTVTLSSSKNATAKIKIETDLLSRLSPPVTRIPVFHQSGAVAYIIHENTLYKFITKITTNPESGLTLVAATFQNLLDDPDLEKILTSFVVVPSSSTLAETKKRMDDERCLDAFVTESGVRTHNVIGWVTNARVLKFVKA